MFHDSHVHPCTLFFDSFHYMLTGRYIWYIGICSLFAGEGYGPAPSIQSFQTKWQRAFLVGCIKLNMQIYFYQSNYTRSSFTGALTINRGHIISREGKKLLYICYIHQRISMRHLRCEVWLKIFPKLLLHWSYILLNSAGPSLDAIFYLSLYSCR